jgi:hypothetical protein
MAEHGIPRDRIRYVSDSRFRVGVSVRRYQPIHFFQEMLETRLRRSGRILTVGAHPDNDVEPPWINSSKLARKIDQPIPPRGYG